MIVYTGGTFDLLHVGHLELIEGCRRLAGRIGKVVVGLNDDDFVARYKGRSTSQPFDRRREVLLALRDVDAVVRNVGGEDSSTAIDVVGPDVIVIGDDWLDHDAADPEARYLRQLGISHSWLADRRLRVEYLPRTRGTSTTALRG